MVAKAKPVLSAKEASEAALTISRELIGAAQDLLSDVGGPRRDAAMDLITRVIAAWRPTSGLQEQRQRIMEALDKMASLSSGDQYALLEPFTAIMAVAKSWADEKPGARASGSRTKSKYVLLADALAEEGHKVSAARLKKERFAAKAKKRSSA